jgi:hypothetical protein
MEDKNIEKAEANDQPQPEEKHKAPDLKPHKAFEDERQVPFEEAQAINAEPHLKDSGVRAVTTWKPEDAANFLAKAIRESQKPMAEALARPSVPASTVWLIIVVMLVFCAGLYNLLRVSDANLNETMEKLELFQSGADYKTREEIDRAMANKVGSVLSSKVRTMNNEKRLHAEYKEKLSELTEKLKVTQNELEKAKSGIGSNDKLSAQLEAATSRVSSLALDVEGKKQELEKQVKKNTSLIKANRLLQNQLDAQAEAMKALQKQLDASRELSKALSGENVPLIEKEQKEGVKEKADNKGDEKQDKKDKKDNVDAEKSSEVPSEKSEMM